MYLHYHIFPAVTMIGQKWTKDNQSFAFEKAGLFVIYLLFVKFIKDHEWSMTATLSLATSTMIELL